MMPSALLRTDYVTAGGVPVTRERSLVPREAFDEVLQNLDTRLGAVLESTYPHAGRYRERSLAFQDPVMQVTARDGTCALALLSESARPCFEAIQAAARRDLRNTSDITYDERNLWAAPRPSHAPVTEASRTTIPSAFDLLRVIVSTLSSGDDDIFGLYGAFAYDAAFVFEPAIEKRHNRDGQRDFVLYIPDRILVTYPGLDTAIATTYTFDQSERRADVPAGSDWSPEVHARRTRQENRQARPYAESIDDAKNAFARGDLFEVVLSQEYDRTFHGSPSTLYRELLTSNPAPYAGRINLGEAEHLVIASPEMFLRVIGDRVESAPIAGTARRGATAVEDHQNLRDLLLSDKSDSELVMCTDVDRNDKSLVCAPGTVEVIAHRDVEVTPRLMHTVEHIVGTLRADTSPLDAFISHMWAVTVTGAPKIGAMQFIERTESSARKWYAGAFGSLLFNGNLDFGITIRAFHIADGRARVRAGNSLLARSITAQEEAECELKAAALLDVIDGARSHNGSSETPRAQTSTRLVRTLIIDHEDSFVHTLADYMRRAGSETTTIRADRGTGVPSEALDRWAPELICLSPGPGSPEEFRIARVLAYATQHRIPVIGVCLGMQAIGEFLGATLSRLPEPAHGIRSEVRRTGASVLLDDMPTRFHVGRYHSLHIDGDTLPAADAITAVTDDGIAMALEDPEHHLYGVQFHPESIMTASEHLGQRLMDRAVRIAAEPRMAALP